MTRQKIKIVDLLFGKPVIESSYKDILCFLLTLNLKNITKAFWILF